MALQVILICQLGMYDMSQVQCCRVELSQQLLLTCQ